MLGWDRAPRHHPTPTPSPGGPPAGRWARKRPRRVSGPNAQCQAPRPGHQPLTQELSLLALGAEAVAAWEEAVGVGLDVPRQAPQAHAQPDLQRQRHVRPAGHAPGQLGPLLVPTGLAGQHWLQWAPGRAPPGAAPPQPPGPTGPSAGIAHTRKDTSGPRPGEGEWGGGGGGGALQGAPGAAVHFVPAPLSPLRV